jgi:hypothetical protein
MGSSRLSSNFNWNHYQNEDLSSNSSNIWQERLEEGTRDIYLDIIDEFSVRTRGLKTKYAVAKERRRRGGAAPTVQKEFVRAEVSGSFGSSRNSRNSNSNGNGSDNVDDIKNNFLSCVAGSVFSDANQSRAAAIGRSWRKKTQLSHGRRLETPAAADMSLMGSAPGFDNTNKTKQPLKNAKPLINHLQAQASIKRSDGIQAFPAEAGPAARVTKPLTAEVSVSLPDESVATILVPEQDSSSSHSSLSSSASQIANPRLYAFQLLCDAPNLRFPRGSRAGLVMKNAETGTSFLEDDLPRMVAECQSDSQNRNMSLKTNINGKPQWTNARSGNLGSPILGSPNGTQSRVTSVGSPGSFLFGGKDAQNGNRIANGHYLAEFGRDDG